MPEMQEISKEIFAFVKANPGSTIKDIIVGLKRPNDSFERLEMQKELRKLRKRNLIRGGETMVGNFCRYYIPSEVM